jgi:hypothetical protein
LKYSDTTKILLSLRYREVLAVRFVTILLMIPVLFPTAADNLQVAASWDKLPYVIPQTHSADTRLVEV